MPYTFTNAGLSMHGTPNQELVSNFQKMMDVDFNVASDLFTIQMEIPYASQAYEDVSVRITRLFDGKTGVSVGDDYKRILFRSNTNPPGLGTMFQFDDNYWIVTNSETIKGIATTCVVRRCNNFLRWKDYDTGVTYTQPCVVDYLIKETRDYSTGGASLVQPSGFLEVIAQFNTVSNKIRPSKRFLFGNSSNWNGFKVQGGGINNHDNRLTADNTSVGLLRISMLANQVNEDTDDIVNGIADAFENVYSLGLDAGTLTMADGDSYSLIATLEQNGSTVSRSLTWTSSNELVATVDSFRVITAIGAGDTTITCSMTENSSVFDVCVVDVVLVPTSNYSVVISPNLDFVYEGEEQIFTTTLYLNGLAQPDVFTYTLTDNGISSNSFRYNVLSGNTFWIKNIQRVNGNNLSVLATSGIHSINIPITLKGAW